MTILRTTDSDVRLLVFRPQLSSEIFDGLSNQVEYIYMILNLYLSNVFNMYLLFCLKIIFSS